MKRPAVFMFAFYLTGLLIGHYINNAIIVSLLLCSTVIVSVILYKTYSWKLLLMFPLICFFAYVNILSATQSFNNCNIDKKFEDSITTNVEGYITDIVFLDDENIQLIVNTQKLSINDRMYNKCLNIKVYSEVYRNNVNEINIGDYVNVTGTLTKFSKPKNHGQFNEENYYKIQRIKYKLFLDNPISKGNIVEKRVSNNIFRTIFYTIKNNLYNLRLRANYIYDRILPNDKANIMKAMILGEKSYLTMDTKEKYSQTGISHILAISGLHIAIVGYSLFQCLCYIFSRKKSVIVTIFILIIYCILTGSSISTIRATMMIIVILLSYLLGRTNDIYSSISIVAIILLIINPFYLWDIGFLLSFSAVLGIVILTPLFDETYNKKNNLIISGFNTSLAATIGTMPIIMYNFYEVRIYAVLVNVLVVPLMSIIVVIGFIGLILGAISTICGRIVSGIVFYILSFYDLCCEILNILPFNTINIGKPKLVNIIAYITLVFLFVWLYKSNENQHTVKKLMKIIIIACLIINVTFGLIPKPLKITQLDIGQGDSTVITSPSNKVYIVDGGGNVRSKQTRDTGYYILRPYLKYNGVNRIECLIMTHSDKDHVGGLIELIDHFKVNKIIVPCVYKNKDDKLFNQLINKANDKDISIYYLKEGDSISDDSITIESLYPSNNVKEFHNNNAHSLVLKLKYKVFDILLTGDIEKQEEQYISERYTNNLQSDTLKVPHHGSASSSTKEFIDNVNPQIAIISCGKKNSYGHPSEEVVKRYIDRNIKVYNTAIDGAITIKTDGYNIGISTYFSKKKEFIKCN